ncbi:hypothetical protein GPZ83_0005005 [Serratia symbiotica]|nr:hypothetical protein GPZ83_0005005 [Serratia symbiotica]
MKTRKATTKKQITLQQAKPEPLALIRPFLAIAFFVFNRFLAIHACCSFCKTIL